MGDSWDDYSFVMRAKNRRLVLMSLATPQTPSSVQHRAKISLNTASRALRELAKRKIVVCKTPNLKVGRVYVLTKKGEKLLKFLEGAGPKR
jgi:DNA-binding HxlR family transcriptional regulator